jgi:Uma2 family endonuclease
MNAPVSLPPLFDRTAFQRFARDGAFGGRRVELRRGKLVEVGPQFAPHRRLKLKLIVLLSQLSAIRDQGWEIGSEGAIDFADDFQPLPDFFVWDPALASANLDGPIPAAAVKLVIEVSSSTLDDDLGDKRIDYARTGLAEYWVVDVKQRLVRRLALPNAAGFDRADCVALNAEVASWTLPGVAKSAGAL